MGAPVLQHLEALALALDHVLRARTRRAARRGTRIAAVRGRLPAVVDEALPQAAQLVEPLRAVLLEEGAGVLRELGVARARLEEGGRFADEVLGVDAGAQESLHGTRR